MSVLSLTIPAGVVIGYDATTSNEPRIPRGAQAAGYDTGPGIAWTPQQYAAHPGALHIDQDPAESDPVADYLDVEALAGTIAGSPGWCKRALADYRTARRPGQRSPSIYIQQSNVTLLVNTLIAGGVTSGIGLIIADWNFTQAQAIASVLAASGPFRIVGRQYANLGWADANVFSVAWLRNVSGKPKVLPPPVPLPVTKENEMPVLALAAKGPAVCLPVPAGMTHLMLYADTGVNAPVAPRIRIDFNGAAAEAALPTWDAPSVTAVPPHGTHVSLARLDDGDVPVTAVWA